MRKLYLFIISGILFTTNVCAQTWQIGFPTATDVEATLSNGTLTISGTGEMENYPNTSAQPWASQRNAITHLVINDGVTSIGNFAFMDFGQLTDVTISGTVETFGDFAFHKSSIRSITISGNSLKKIGLQAFDDCRNLITITLPASIETIYDYAFYSCNIQSVSILGNSLKTIGFGAFAWCPNLKSVNLPASVESIGETAFANCGALAEVDNYAVKPLIIESNVFNNANTGACILRVPAASIEEYQKAVGWMKFDNIVALEVEITLELDKIEIYLLTGASTDIKAIVTGSENVEWRSGQTAVATVNKGATVSGYSGKTVITASIGAVTAISPGTTVITASAESTEATCTVTVIEQGKSTIEGNVNSAGGSNVRVNLYMKPPESDTKRGIIGGYVLLATTVPNGNGEYKFEDLPEGSYQVDVEIDEYESEATPAINLSDSETRSNINFEVNETTGTVAPKIATGAVETWHAASLQIYPNPFTDVVHITGAVAVETWRAASLQIFNTAGTIVHTQTISSPDETINLGHLPPGMYIIRLENGETVKMIKIQ